MFRRRLLVITCPLFVITAIFLLKKVARPVSPATKQRVFEIRTYYTEPGKLPDLLKRFREHTTKLFESTV
jgi:hypothetical protein